jgi:hypothetical protein
MREESSAEAVRPFPRPKCPSSRRFPRQLVEIFDKDPAWLRRGLRGLNFKVGPGPPDRFIGWTSAYPCAMTTAGWSHQHTLGATLLVLLLLAMAVAVPVAGSLFRAGPSDSSSNASPFFAAGDGGAAVTALYAVYSERPDLQAAFPQAHTNMTSYTELVSWAGGVAIGGYDSAYSALAPYGYWYVLMEAYNGRSDLQAAFPNAYSNPASFAELVSWAGGVVMGHSDSHYSVLEPYGYWYVLMATYNARPDLQAAFPSAYTNSTSFDGLVSWAGGVVVGGSDSYYQVLAPFGYWYVLMATYNARPDLQAAFPSAYSNFTSYQELVRWAGGVVTGGSDSYYPVLAPFGYWYVLMATYNGRPDLQAAFPVAYTNFPSYAGLISWAGEVVSGAPDSSYAALAPFGYWYALMEVYNYRSDLQSSFPGALSNFASFAKLVNWAGWVSDTDSDIAYLTLAPFGYYYNMMYVYDGRLDLQTAFPNAYTNWGSEVGLASWSGAVVNGTIRDSSEPTLQPYGYWFVLIWVYDQRPGLQAQYPMVLTNEVSYHGLIAWADAVVSFEFPDPAYTTLAPFTLTYQALG